MNSYSIIELIIYLEIAIIMIIVVLASLARLYYSAKINRNAKIKLEIIKYIETCIAENLYQLPKRVPKSWKNFPVLIAIIQDYNQKHLFEWEKIKLKVFNILLPLANAKFSSRKWLNRLFSAQAFELMPAEYSDNNKILLLLNDAIPIVRLYAAMIAIKKADQQLINVIIDAIAQQGRVQQTIYLQLFELSNPIISSFLVERLCEDSDPNIGVVCYKLLKMYPSLQIEGIEQDMDSDDLELRLAAIRYFAYSQQFDAVEKLTQLLSDDEWQIRLVAVQLLGQLHPPVIAANVAHCLSDLNWWVRVNAALALLNFGEEGEKLLHSQDPNVDLYAYEAAQHVLQKYI